MAAPMKSRLKSVEKTSEIQFDGTLPSTVRGQLSIELIKFIMYQRQQIPMQFDHIVDSIALDQTQRQRQNDNRSRRQPPKDTLTAANGESNEVLQDTRNGMHERIAPATQLRGLHQLNDRKKKQAVSSLQQIFHTLEMLFNIGPPVRQVLIILGSTIVSPKETYRLVFPFSHCEETIVGLKKAKSGLFRHLVSSDFVCDGSTMTSLSKLIVLVQAERDAAFAEKYHLIVKDNYKVPPRGKRYAFQLRCPERVSCNVSRLEDVEFELSGVEPMERTVDNEQAWLQNEARLRHLSLEEVLAQSTPMVPSRHVASTLTPGGLWPAMSEAMTPGVIDLTDEAACTWYQLPVAAKGYRIKDSHSKQSWF